MLRLLRFTSDKALMGRFVNSPITSVTGWVLFAAITGANLALVWQSFQD
jgi:manganese transport protein